MKCAFLTTLLGLFGCIATASGSDQMRYYDVTTTSDVIKTGKLFLLEDSYDLDGIRKFSSSRLIYVLGAKGLYPEGNLEITEAIFQSEGFRWGDEEKAKRVFIPSFVELFLGLKTSLLDSHYYFVHSEFDREDNGSISKLRTKCALPSVSMSGDRWSVTLCVIQERVGVCPVDRYTIEGVITPFHITKLVVEDMDLNRSIILKNPAPR